MADEDVSMPVLSDKKTMSPERQAQLAKARELALAKRRENIAMKNAEKTMALKERSVALEEKKKALEVPPLPPPSQPIDIPKKKKEKEKLIVYVSDESEPEIEYVRKPKERVELLDAHSRGYVEDHLRRIKRENLMKSMFSP